MASDGASLPPPAPPQAPAKPALPPSVRIVRAAAAWCRRRRRRLGGLLLAAAVAGWIADGIYAVANGSSAVVRRFGRLAEPRVGPGLHLALPPGIDSVAAVKTGEVLRQQVGGDDGAPLQLVTGDENLIESMLVVQYRVTSPGSYLFRSEDPGALLTRAVRAALVDEIARRPVDEVLTSGKAAIQSEVRRKAQATLQRYGAGLSLVAVSLQAVTPPAEAAAAFLEVNDARAQAARAVNDAESRRETSFNLARGRAEREQDEARSWADARLQKARGAASRFEQVLAQARLTPEQTRTDFYLDTVRKVLPRARIVVLAPGAAPKLDIFLSQDATAGGGAPGGLGAGRGGTAAPGPGVPGLAGPPGSLPAPPGGE
ncbi:MAG TPA: FtsH protease activity modulator HflK [Thermoanaerobaculia bacterium]|nr:FtsH protease activity modulator HflK [Thermoanaerobaculia bacterium]